MLSRDKRRPAWQKGKPHESPRNRHPSERRRQAERGVPLRANPRHRAERRGAGVVQPQRHPRSKGGRPTRWAVFLRCSWRCRQCPEHTLPTRIIAPARAPVAQVHPLGTDGFRYWTAAEALRRTAAFWATAGARAWHPDVGASIPVRLDDGDRPERVLRAERLSARGYQAGPLLLPRYRPRCRHRPTDHGVLGRESRRRRTRARSRACSTA